MKRLVTPISAKYVRLSGNTKITLTLKKAFKKNKILGKKPEDIDRHMMVQHFPIAENEGLYAEFALLNAKYHLTETADFRPEYLGGKEKSKVASLAAIKFVEAKRIYSDIGCDRYVVYGARNDNEVRGQLALLANHSDGVINVKSKAEMAAYMEKIMRAASRTVQIPSVAN
jgi:hypothetical protein